MFGKLFEIAPAPPDGWKAFVVACSGCLLQTVNFGISNSFGSFSYAFHEDEALGNPSLTQVAIVGSFATGIGPILGIFSGIAVAKLGCRFTCLFSSMCCTLSMILSSLLANSIVTLILTYSIFAALAGFMVAAGATATSTWFVKRKALGMGINFCGGGMGSLTVPFIAGTLQSKYDWRTCFLILSSLTVLGMISSFFICLRTEEENEDEKEEGNNKVNEAPHSTMQVTTSEEDKPITDWRAARHEREFTPKELFHHIMLTRDFIVLFLLLALFSTGLFAMVYSCVPYALSMGRAGTIYADAPVVTINNAVLVFVAQGGVRIVAGPILGYIASVHVGDKIVCTFCCALYSVLFLLWIACRELWHHLVMMGLMGICLSGFFATYPSIIGYKFHGPNLPIVMAMQFVSGSVGGFLGGPLATALTEANNGDYTTAFIVLAVLIFINTLLVAFGIDCDKVSCGGRREECENKGAKKAENNDNDGKQNEPMSP